MATNTNLRLRTSVIQADRSTLIAIQALPDYAPSNPAYRAEALARLSAAMVKAQEAEIRARNAFEAARDTAREAEWELHNALLGAKTQISAQYGADSDAIQSLGLKKKSHRKRPMRKKLPA